MHFNSLDALSICVKSNIRSLELLVSLTPLHQSPPCMLELLDDSFEATAPGRSRAVCAPWAGALLAGHPQRLREECQCLISYSKAESGSPVCLLVQNVGADRRASASDGAARCANLMECGVPDFKGKGWLPRQPHMGAGGGGSP